MQPVFGARWTPEPRLTAFRTASARGDLMSLMLGDPLHRRGRRGLSSIPRLIRTFEHLGVFACGAYIYFLFEGLIRGRCSNRMVRTVPPFPIFATMSSADGKTCVTSGSGAPLLRLAG